MATISAIRFNKPIKEFYLKLKAKGKPGRVCIVACMNKLIRIIPRLFGTQYIMGGKLCSKTRCCIKKIYKRLDRIIVCSIYNKERSER